MRGSAAGFALLAALSAAVAEPVATGPPGAARHVGFLASSRLGDRAPGSAGEKLAAAYLGVALEQIGARPLEGADGFVWSFTARRGIADAGSRLALPAAVATKEPTVHGEPRVRALAFSPDAEVSAGIAFAGYGIAIPAGDRTYYDSFAGLDLSGKIAIVLRGVPDGSDGEQRRVLLRWSGSRDKARALQERGAAGMLVVDSAAGAFVPGLSLPGESLPAATVDAALAAEILARAGKSLDDVRTELDTGNPHVSGFEIPGLRLSLRTAVRREPIEARNVLGYLPAKSEPTTAEPDGWVVLGACVDGPAGEAADGSDGDPERDNAPGVAVLLAAGERLAAFDLKRPVLLAFWSGGEQGRLGARAFLGGGPLPPERIAAYLDVGGVGSPIDERLHVDGIGTSASWPGALERANAVVGLDVRVTPRIRFPTEAAEFVRAGIPAVDLATGPASTGVDPDRAATRSAVDVEGLDRAARFAALLTRRVALLSDRPAFRDPAAEVATAERAARPFTGTLPDYAADAEGLRLEGVIEGGPADHAGLREGDVIVAVGSTPIGDVYDYTRVLDQLRIGVPVTVTVVRQGERLELTLIPEARK